MTKTTNPHGQDRQEFDRLVLLADQNSYPTVEDAQYAEAEPMVPTCSICDGIGHGYPGAGPCPIESPDPLYYADELAAGR